MTGTIEDWVDEYVIPAAESHTFIEIGAAHHTHLEAILHWDSVRIDRTEWPNVEQHIVTAENISDIIGNRIPQDFDLLLIDIDGNDLHVWKAIQQNPRVVIIEYNATAPTGWVIPYDPDHYYDGSDWFGASLLAMAQHAHSQGMELVEVDDQGANALFLQLDLAVKHKWRTLFPKPSHSPRWKE